VYTGIVKKERNCSLEKEGRCVLDLFLKDGIFWTID
jgi:hypothetical protein